MVPPEPAPAGRVAPEARIETPPSASVAIPCGYFDAGLCRSCALLDVDYATQLAGKQARLRELIDRFGDAASGGIDWRGPVASEVAGFRTKAKLVIGGTTDAPTLGILDRELRGVDLEDCPIVAAPIRAVLPRLAAFITTARLVPYDVAARRGELKYLIITANAGGELMLRFVLRSTESVLRIRKHLPALRSELPQLRVVSVNLLPEHKAVLEGDEELALTDETALDLPFFPAAAAGAPTGAGADELSLRVLPRSFVQTNGAIAAQLYAAGAAWAVEFAPRMVWDLYCGVGGFALHIAQALRISSPPNCTNRDNSGRFAQFADEAHRAPSTRGRATGASASGARPSVTGVELSEDAVASASLAAQAAGLEASFIAADATSWAVSQTSVPDLVVVNPPRRGIGAELAGWLEGSGVRHVLYSSCNADSLARDLAAMPSLVPVRAQLFDMFPHTTHFETLVLLARR